MRYQSYSILKLMQYLFSKEKSILYFIIASLLYSQILLANKEQLSILNGTKLSELTANSIVQVGSSYPDSHTQKNKPLVGIGFIGGFYLNNYTELKYFVLTSSHLSQGQSSFFIKTGKGQLLKPILHHNNIIRLANNESDLELILIENPHLPELFLFDFENNKICKPISANTLVDENVFSLFSKAVLLPKIPWSNKAVSNMDVPWSLINDPIAINSLRFPNRFYVGTWKTWDNRDWVFDNEAFHGISGTPLFRFDSKASQICVEGLVKGIHRYYKKAYSSTHNQVSELFHEFKTRLLSADWDQETSRYIGNARWNVQSGETFRIFSKATEQLNQEIFMSYSPTGGPDTADSGGPDTADSGGPDTADSGGPDTADSGGPDTADSGGPDTADSGGPDTADSGKLETSKTSNIIWPGMIWNNQHIIGFQTKEQFIYGNRAGQLWIEKEIAQSSKAEIKPILFNSSYNTILKIIKTRTQQASNKYPTEHYNLEILPKNIPEQFLKAQKLPACLIDSKAILKSSIKLKLITNYISSENKLLKDSNNPNWIPRVLTIELDRFLKPVRIFDPLANKTTKIHTTSKHMDLKPFEIYDEVLKTHVLVDIKGLLFLDINEVSQDRVATNINYLKQVYGNLAWAQGPFWEFVDSQKTILSRIGNTYIDSAYIIVRSDRSTWEWPVTCVFDSTAKVKNQ